MTPEQVNELRERSKDDRAFIAGSEVRMLCGEVDRLSAERDRLREDLAKAVAMLNGQTVELPLEFKYESYTGKVKP